MMLTTDEIRHFLGDLKGVDRWAIVRFGGEKAAREILAGDWVSMELGKNNQVWLRRKDSAKVIGPESLRRTLRASFYGLALRGRMTRNAFGLPRGLYIHRDAGLPTGFCYFPDDFCSPTTIARAVNRKFEMLRSEPHTKELLRNNLRIEVVVLWAHKKTLVETEINRVNEQLLKAATIVSLVEDLKWPVN
jgi:hypothetical protein